MVEQMKPDDWSQTPGKQVRNRYSSAGITQREANQIRSMVSKIAKILKKQNLYVGYAQKLLDAGMTLETVLEESGHL